MKTFKAFATLFSLLVLFSVSSTAQSTWTYTTYAVIQKNTKTVLKLEFGIKSKGFDGYVDWIITNSSPDTFYDVGLASRKYTLSDGSVHNKTGEHMTPSTLRPGEVTSIPADYVDSGKAGLNNIGLENPMIKLSTEENGSREGWEVIGKVKMP